MLEDNAMPCAAGAAAGSVDGAEPPYKQYNSLGEARSEPTADGKGSTDASSTKGSSGGTGDTESADVPGLPKGNIGKKAKKKGGHKVASLLNVAAASVLSGLLYAARVARYDLIQPIQMLATELHD